MRASVAIISVKHGGGGPRPIRYLPEDSMENLDISQRITALENGLRRNRRVAVIGPVIAFMIGLTAAVPLRPTYAQSDARSLTVRELTVVDEKGVPRVRLGAPLPDPTVMGKQVPRQGVVSGLMIYDADGDE